MAIEHVERRAARIKERREELGLTQEQVADLMHAAHGERHPDEPPDQTRGQMVSDWERAVNAPSPPKLELLAVALKTSVADLSSGPTSQRGAAPDLLRTMSADEATQLDRIEKQLQDIRDVLARLDVPLTPPVSGPPLDVPEKLQPDPDRQPDAPAEEPGESGA